MLFRCTVLSSPFFVSFNSIVFRSKWTWDHVHPYCSLRRIPVCTEMMNSSRCSGKRLETILQRRGYSCSRLRNLALPVGSFFRRTSLAGLTETFSLSIPSR